MTQLARKANSRDAPLDLSISAERNKDANKSEETVRVALIPQKERNQTSQKTLGDSRIETNKN